MLLVILKCSYIIPSHRKRNLIIPVIPPTTTNVANLPFSAISFSCCDHAINSYFFSIPHKSQHPNGRPSKCIRFPRNERELLQRPIYPKFLAAASSVKRGRERKRTRTGFVDRCYATSKRHRKRPLRRRRLRCASGVATKGRV